MYDLSSFYPLPNCDKHSKLFSKISVEFLVSYAKTLLLTCSCWLVISELWTGALWTFIINSFAPVDRCCCILHRWRLVLLPSMLNLVVLLNPDPAGAGVRSLCGLVGPGGANVRDDGRTASVRSR